VNAEEVERIVRLALDFAEARIGHDGTIKSDAGEVREFAERIADNEDASASFLLKLP
jgi:hypothetical protein